MDLVLVSADLSFEFDLLLGSSTVRLRSETYTGSGRRVLSSLAAPFSARTREDCLLTCCLFSFSSPCVWSFSGLHQNPWVVFDLRRRRLRLFAHRFLTPPATTPAAQTEFAGLNDVT